jgi:hypothetical protein
VIRLGSLAGYPFEGPRLLGGWTPPAAAAVYAIMYRPEQESRPGQYAVIYVGHAADLAAERFPFQHPRASCWVKRAGSRWKVYVATYEVPGGGQPHREQITRELMAVYQPRCNSERYDQAWAEHWIASEPAGGAPGSIAPGSSAPDSGGPDRRRSDDPGRFPAG